MVVCTYQRYLITKLRCKGVRAYPTLLTFGSDGIISELVLDIKSECREALSKADKVFESSHKYEVAKTGYSYACKGSSDLRTCHIQLRKVSYWTAPVVQHLHMCNASSNILSQCRHAMLMFPKVTALIPTYTSTDHNFKFPEPRSPLRDKLHAPMPFPQFEDT